MRYLLTQAVDRAAERDPDRDAIRFAGTGLSYAELATRSDRLAQVLVTEGVTRGDRVGIYLAKSHACAVAVYGIMKAGAAYVPLDPAAPVARTAFILRDCGIRHLVTEPARAGQLPSLAAEAPLLECVIGAAAQPAPSVRIVPWCDVELAPTGPRSAAPIELDLAYILYTSGSTGVPKGVVHTHRSALSFAEGAAATYGLRPEDRLSNHAPLHFDLSTLDFFAGAVAGATTVIVPEAVTKLPASLSKLLEEERLTVLYAVPFALVQLALYGALGKRDLRPLRWVLFGGEPFPPKHLRMLMAQLPAAQFCNVYGPTEVNGVTHHLVTPLGDADAPIPIGRPYANVHALVVDQVERPVAPGEPGQLLIRSPTMMRGYWGRPDLDEGAFARRPVDGGHEDVFLRTGDLVRELPSGDLAFLGRRDRQIKAKGYRVELDEVEAALLTHPGIEAAAAFAMHDPTGFQIIAAAVVLRPGAALTSTELLREVGRLLPVYALPEKLDILPELPRTTTDKIDRLHLRARAEAGARGSG